CSRPEAPTRNIPTMIQTWADTNGTARVTSTSSERVTNTVFRYVLPRRRASVASLLSCRGSGAPRARGTLVLVDEVQSDAERPYEGQSFHAYLTGSPERADRVASFHFFPARRPVVVDGYSGPYSELLEVMGVAPYRHQVRAFAAVAAGHDVVVATPTASGKSLVFQVPVVDAVVADKTSILLYPTKALAHDQLERLRATAATMGLEPSVIDTYDGDTPSERRAQVRTLTRCVLTNPDMLHYGVLPHHGQWAAFLGSLEFLVLDELHAYRGVLGTHVANVVRRLLRMARRYGANPRVIAASATVGNPGEHVTRLTGRPAVVIEQDDAPSGPREFIVWRPPTL